MSIAPTSQTMQFVALFLAAIEFSLALYVLLLNLWHPTNRHVSALLAFGATTLLAQGLLTGATDLAETTWATWLLAAVSPAVQPMILIVPVVLLKPSWILGPKHTQRHGRWRWLWWPIYGLIFLPALLTLADITQGTQFWYTGLDAETYAGGFVSMTTFTDGALSPMIRGVIFRTLPLLSFIPLLYVALLDRAVTPLTRRLAWVLLIQLAIGTVFQLGLRNVLVAPTSELVTSVIFAVAYAYVVFRQMVSERRVQKGRLLPRLTALILVVVAPLLAVVPALISIRAGTELEQQAVEQLQASNRSLGANISLWLDLNVQALNQLVSLPDIVSMEAERQKPVLEAMAAAHPHMYLVSTTDLSGVNIARNDDTEPKDYSDRLWFLEPKGGAPLTLQSLIGRTSGKPALVASAPIQDQSGEIIGVGMFASNLTDLAHEVQVTTVGATGFAYVVDAENKVIAHPDLAFFESTDLVDMSNTAPVVALRQGIEELISFTDEEGQKWRAHVEELDNGWGVIVQQPEADLLNIQKSFQNLSWGLIGMGLALLIVLTWSALSQAIRPIGALTEAATAIAAGDLSTTARVESEDEIGVLARTFNNMTTQLRDLISGLEQRVVERTQELEEATAVLAARSAELEKSNQNTSEINRQLEEAISQSRRRAVLLYASNEVSHAASQIRELDQLLPRVVELISQHFGYYHSGIFILDEAQQYAVLTASNSKGGQRMLARQHRLAVGSEGIVGYVTASGKPRIALDVGADAVHFDNPDLPDTRSEMAVPLRVGNEIIGALDVQSTKVSAFGSEDAIVLGALGEQISVAIQNARLFQEAEEAVARAEKAQKRYVQQEWTSYLRQETTLPTHEYTSRGVAPVGDAPLPEMELARLQGKPVILKEEKDPLSQTALAMPIRFRDQIIGTLGLYAAETAKEWSADEIALVQDVADQIGLALENARLFEQTERRARREAMIGQIVAQVRRQPDIDSIMQTAVRELGKALGAPRTFIQLTSPLDASVGSQSEEPPREMSDDGN